METKQQDNYDEDKELICVECKEIFVFGKNEQEFYKEKHFVTPKRCRAKMQGISLSFM